MTSRRFPRSKNKGALPPAAWLTALLLCVVSHEALAETAVVAVASSFRGTLETLAPQFESTTGHRLTIVSGSTGLLAAQIEQGAPYDVFLAADTERPHHLAGAGIALAESAFVYARGQLALYSRDGRANAGLAALDKRLRTLAIADPATAPYGAAAKELLERRGDWQRLEGRIAYSQNVAGAFAAVASGAADLGLIALPLLLAADRSPRGAHYRVPAGSHSPLEHCAVLLTRASANAAARSLLEFLRSPDAQRRIARDGYTTG